ncbi:MAG: glucokinase, partial [Chloroflexi bacterium]|nr:glucokinase [Chloroflexota bacterium]
MNNKSIKQFILAGDLGATNLRLALFDIANPQYQAVEERKFAVKEFNSLEEILNIYTNNLTVEIIGASFAVAGPVINGVAKITNVDWKIIEESLSENLKGIPVSLQNDLVGMSSSIPILQPDHLININPGQVVENGAVAVIAPGTGLGEGFLVSINGEYQAFQSEGGHSDFGPRNDLEMDLLKYLRSKYSRVSYERICSGLGIPDLYQFLKERGDQKESPVLANELLNAQDKTPLIINAATPEKDPDPLSYATMKLFVNILGAEAGNLALKVVASGGVYIGGGIPPRIIPLLRKHFLEAFFDKGRFQ